MAARAFFLPGVFFLFSAFVLLLLVSISLPGLPAIDIARSHFTSGVAPHVTTKSEAIEQIRFGIWAYCIYDAPSGHRSCVDPGHGYSVHLESTSNSVTIGSAATRGLAVHPVAAGVSFIAFLLSFSAHITLTLLASILSFLAAILTLIAFAIDIALYVMVHNKVNNLHDVHVHSVAGPGFWMTLAALILLLFAGCTVCFGRRRARMAGASDSTYPEKPGFLGRFRRRRAAV
ncbi:actin cortical patch SUR7/pH-response regulator pali [Gloeopeniophorella convolvens]|nr:actin cortical patch SUR7/pH-response regulator pali [Gloeopeniophorella convolvens]